MQATNNYGSGRWRVAGIASILLCISGLLWAQWPRTSLPAGTAVDRVIVRKEARVLALYQGSRLVRTYSIALGRHPLGDKQQEGDGRTPEGAYVLDYRNPNSAFHKSFHISYPGPDDVAAANARGVSAGSMIMVHGIRNGLGFVGRFHRLFDWTDGCIAVSNQDIDEIWRVVPVGTPIVIEP